MTWEQMQAQKAALRAAREEELRVAREAYDNTKIYAVGDVVRWNSNMYRMIDAIGVPGYPPPRPSNWKFISGKLTAADADPYNNGKIYAVGDFISHDGRLYEMIVGIGGAGYPPPLPVHWRFISEYIEVRPTTGATTGATTGGARTSRRSKKTKKSKRSKKTKSRR